MVLLEEEKSYGVVDLSNRWYDKYVESLPSLDDRVAIITGANSGIGFWAANAMAYKGCRVVLACRSLQKANAAKKEILRRFPDAHLDVMELDNMDFGSVRGFAQRFQRKYQRLDYLVNNAGIMTRPYTLSKNGFDCQFQTNHLAHFLLTKLLWNTMLQTPGQSRVVMHSSAFHFIGLVRFDRNQPEFPPYGWGILGLNLLMVCVVFPLCGMRNLDQWFRYFVTKLANLLFMRELAAKIEEKGLQDKIIATASHPGFSSTKLLGKAGHNWLGWKFWARVVGQSAADGSTSLLEATVGPRVGNSKFVGPRYLACGPPMQQWTFGSGNSKAQAKDLWLYSEECIDSKFEL